ncbi:Rad7, putative isoform 4 [Hibiscus syriacus]|uniref:Rad7, putative isoform 4 n=1 Tax=Hibiscus syriacus TaxID=106335 RepID=A0A6A3B843_HIBSY|nr:Rad7, putative isoform 4 [Hibiscus syriacus]
MGDVGFSEKTDSQESDENSREKEEGSTGFSTQQHQQQQQRNAPLNFDLNLLPEIVPVDSDPLFPGIPTTGFVKSFMGIELRIGGDPGAETAGSSIDYRYLSKYSTKKAAAPALKSVVVDDDDDNKEQLGTPFGMAMEMIKTRVSRKMLSSGGLEVEFKWNADVIVSLDHVPDMLRHKLTRLLCDSRKMDAHFLQLLASGLPEEIRINDCSQVTEDEFTKIFGCCDTNNLTIIVDPVILRMSPITKTMPKIAIERSVFVYTWLSVVYDVFGLWRQVLQLDLCGSCMPDYVLRDTLACSSKSLPALATLSLNGAHRMTDEGLNMLALSAPALQSINLSHCSLLTSAGINNLANCFESTLRELYLDECHNIEAMVVLPALKKLKCLEVLSMAGIPTVCDDFVIQMVEACGKNMKELVFTNCLELTDVSIKSVGKNCSKLCTIDLSYLSKLTDKSLRYLANGCRSINRLKLIRNRFSDEAIAAFLEASGSDLTELSLNNIALVGLNTALALSKCSRKLFSLDLSWCRHLNDEALGLIVDSCLSLKQLKLFGCTQMCFLSGTFSCSMQLTDVFLKGHSNPQVQIIGQELRTVSKFLNVLKPQEPPLRYSPIGRLH